MSIDKSANDEWIPVSEKLPAEGQTVIVYDGNILIATIEKGISVEDRERMSRGEIPDPIETVWNLSRGYFTVRRSESYKRCDEHDNNLKPYCWRIRGAGTIFGQNVKYWMPCPEPPKPEQYEEVQP